MNNIALIPYRGNDAWRRESVSTVINWVHSIGLKCAVVGTPDTYTHRADYEIHVPNTSFQKTVAWNKGIQYLFSQKIVSRESAIIMLDSDILPETHTIQKALRLLDNPYIVAVHPFDEIEDLDKTRTWGINHSTIAFNELEQLYADFLRKGRRCYGGAFIVKAGAFVGSGGFDTNFKGWGHEDDMFYYAMRRKYPCGRVIRIAGLIRHLYHDPQNTPEYVKSETYKANSRHKLNSIMKLKYSPSKYFRTNQLMNGLRKEWEL